jgi:GTP pyrophosphokinase
MSTSKLDEIKTAFINLRDEAHHYLTPQQIEIVDKSYNLALACISSKLNYSETLLLVSLRTAFDLAWLRLNTEFLASVLLYYPVLTGNIQVIQIAEFGGPVIQIIQKLVQISNLIDKILPRMQSKQLQETRFWKNQYTENFPDAFIDLAKPPEIVVIKLLDRLHLLRNSEELFPEPFVRRNLAEETLDGFAAVAERLGIWLIKWQLEDAAFKILQPKIYQNIKRDLSERRQEREKIVKNASEILSNALVKEGLVAEVNGRPKHIWGLYMKMKQTGQSAKDVNDNLGIRVITNTKEDCYQALSILFRTWPPAQGIYGSEPFRDWIVSPKQNGYQSIHTTVLYTQNKDRLLEVQIRTHEMHKVAEYGVAAHWIYKTVGNKFPSRKKLQKRNESYSTIHKSFGKHRKRN